MCQRSTRDGRRGLRPMAISRAQPDVIVARRSFAGCHCGGRTASCDLPGWHRQERARATGGQSTLSSLSLLRQARACVVPLALTDPNDAMFAIVFVMGNEDLPCRLPRIGAHIRAALAEPPEMAPTSLLWRRSCPDQWSPASPASRHLGRQGTFPGDSYPGRRGCGVGYRSQPRWHLLSVRTSRPAMPPVQSDFQVLAPRPDKLSSTSAFGL